MKIETAQYSLVAGWFVALLIVAQSVALGEETQGSSSPVNDTSTFQIVLAVGEKDATVAEGAAAMPEVALPENVAHALDDVRQLLPYQYYRILDVALISGDGESHTRMAGPNGHTYELELVHSRDQVVYVERLRLVNASRTARPVVIDTSFSVDPRETIVVGSSRLNGGHRALIVLFTSVD